MKEVKRYICDGCGDVCQTEESALRCEEHHKNKDRLKNLEIVTVSMGGITIVPGVRTEAESRKASPEGEKVKYYMMPGTIKIKHTITGDEAWYKHAYYHIGPFT